MSTTACPRCAHVGRQLELRRQLDVDGWTADVTSLRKTLAAVDRKLLQMRLIDRWDEEEVAAGTQQACAAA